MKKVFGLFLTLSLSMLLFSTPSLSTTLSEKPDDTRKLKVLESYGNLPLSFIENKGQVDKKVSFYLKGSQGTIYFTKEAIIYDLIAGELRPSKREEIRSKEVKRLSFTLKPVGAQKGMRLVANERLPGRVNSFIGNDPKGWQRDIPIYPEILYEGLFAGIDLRLYGTNDQMEYDFVVHPGADPDDIRMAFNGIEGLKVDEAGNLIIRTALGDLKHLRPVIYQEIEGRRQMVEGSFKVAQKSFGFTIKDYNKNYPLIIDPFTLSYSTYLGGSNWDTGLSITVDPSGNAYVSGMTDSTDFPTQNPYQGISGGSNDVFVTKFSPAGDTLIYSTYLGGSSWENGYGIAVEPSGNAYVTGHTRSTDFPTVNPYQGASAGLDDVFVTKLGPAGDTLIYSTYLGGSGNDYCFSIAVDSSGNAYVTGHTHSTDFPTVNAYQGAFGGWSDAFVTKLGPAGDTLIYSTYLGGNKDTAGRGIAVDSSGNAYVTGSTSSADFPTQNPYQGTFGGGTWDAFVTRLAPAGGTLIYSTYLGGSGDEYGVGIAVDSSGNAYVTGYTYSTDFPTVNPYQGTWGGGSDAFVTRLGPAGDTIIYSTYLGGSSNDYGYGITLDSSGNAHVTGETSSGDFPTENPYQGTIGGPVDAFVTKFSPAGDTIIYSTYLGGSGSDTGWGIAVDSSGNTYVTGRTNSTDFPTENPYQGTFGGGPHDGFVAKLSWIEPRAYITNYGDNTVSVIDISTNTVIDTIPVGDGPEAVAVNQASTRVYVANYLGNSVSVLDATTNRVVATIPVGSGPRGMSVNWVTGRAYVTNRGENNVSVIDTTTNTVIATIPVGSEPHGSAINLAGTRLYVADYGDQRISVIDTATNTLIATVPVGTNPAGVVVHPMGTRVYVSNNGSNTVSVIDTATNTVVTTVPVGSNPIGLTVNPTGTRVYVTNWGDNSLSVISSVDNTVIATVPVGSNPRGVGVNPAGTFAYVANKSDNTVSVIDTVTNTVVDIIPVGNLPYALGNFIGPTAPIEPFAYITNRNDNGVSVMDTSINTVTDNISVDNGPIGVAVHPAGTRVYVANRDTTTLSVIDTATNSLIDTVTLGSRPCGVAVNPIGTRVYVTLIDGHVVSVIDTATNTVIGTIPVGVNPYGVAVHPAGTHIYVANYQVVSNSLSVIETATNTVVATVPMGGCPIGVAVHPLGTRVYVTNLDGSSVSVVDTATNTVIDTIAVTRPWGIAVHPAGLRLYVANFNSNTVSVIDTTTNNVIATVPVGANPVGVAVNPTGTHIYVTNRGGNDVSVIEAATNTVVDTIPVGNYPFAFGDSIRPPWDTDGDGLSDEWEIACFGNINQGPGDDYDGDGLSNLEEFQVLTDPTNPDTDTDGMPDGWEVQYGFNPLDPTDAAGDNDGDGLTNVEEYQEGTDPTTSDTDSDQVPDGWEVQYGLDPLDDSDAAQDNDGDGLTNLEEYQEGTDPTSSDTDSDGMPDPWEIQYGFNPVDPLDADDDPDGDGLTNLGEYQAGTNPGNSDTDSDQIPDGWEVQYGLEPTNPSDAAADSDGDGLSNLQEYQAGTDPTNSDTDSDGMPDGWEVQYGFNPLDETDSDDDPDADGMTNLEEYVRGTDPTVGSGPFAYITNISENTISVIDTATNTVTATIPVGNVPVAVSVNPAGTRVYVTNRDDDTVSVIDSASNTVIATIPVGAGPNGVACNQSGTLAYVSNYTSGTVSVIDTGTNSVIDTITVGTGPGGIAVNSDGTRVYVANEESDSVSVINAETNGVIATVLVGDGPLGVTVHPAGSSVYVTNGIDNTVSLINTRRNTLAATVPVGNGSFSVSVHPRGFRVYVTNYADNTVSIMNTLTNTVIATMPVGTGPRGVAINRAGTRAYVANETDDTVSVIDVATNTVVDTVPVGDGPCALGNFVGPLDNDGDGLDDQWEELYFGNLSQGADGDPDGDGLSNLQEYQKGTDPTNANATGNLSIEWTMAKVNGPNSYGQYKVMAKVIIQNEGATASPEGMLKVYASSDPDLDGGDTLVGEIPLPAINAGAVVNKRVRGTVLLPTQSPLLYLIAYVETGEEPTVETSVAAAELLNGGIDLNGALIEVTKTGPTRNGGYSVRCSFSAANTGSLPSGKCEFQVYYSTDDTLDDPGDTPLFVDRPKRLPKLRPGLARPRAFGYTFDHDPAGNYVIIKLDSGDALTEIDETNNEIVVLIP